MSAAAWIKKTTFTHTRAISSSRYRFLNLEIESFVIALYYLLRYTRILFTRESSRLRMSKFFFFLIKSRSFCWNKTNKNKNCVSNRDKTTCDWYFYSFNFTIIYSPPVTHAPFDVGYNNRNLSATAPFCLLHRSLSHDWIECHNSTLLGTFCIRVT